MKALLTRISSTSKQTLGELRIYDGYELLYECKTLELPWQNNERQVSCIPDRAYNVVPRNSEKYGDHFHVTEVPDRDWILIHVANYVRQLRGCIAVGSAFSDIDSDGLLDVTSSRLTMDRLLEVAPNGFILSILTI